MPTPLHVAVIGAGAIGGWTALELVRSGASVTLLDAWGPGNLRSSSSGERRILRANYGPDGFYSGLVERALEQWLALEQSVGRRLFERTGLLWLFKDLDSYALEGSRHLEAHGFSLEELSVAKSRARFPRIDFEGVRKIYFEPGAGLLAARTSTRLVRDLFVREGGTYRCARALTPVEAPGTLSEVELAGLPAIRADAFVFACGPWLRELLPETLGHLIRPSRQQEFYLGPPPGPGYGPSDMPPWLDFGERMRYGVPAIEGRGLKIADDSRGEPFDPTDGERTPDLGELRQLRRFLSRRLPELAEAPLLEARVCQYENSPDGHLIVDRHPRLENVWMAGGGSGHAFKLAPAIGERVARMIRDGAASEPAFEIGRFAGRGSAVGSSSQYDA